MAVLFYTLFSLAVFIIAGWCFVWLMHLMAIVNAKLKFHRKIQMPSPEAPLPGISIIKPLVGVDPNLFSNLETFFTLNYPLYELLFCIQDESDPSIMLVRRLIEKYPTVDTRVFLGGMKIGVNPKINNMQPGYEAAKYDLILVSDSGIRMKEDTLLDMSVSMKDDVALVHQMPFACDRKGFPSILEKAEHDGSVKCVDLTKHSKNVDIFLIPGILIYQSICIQMRLVGMRKDSVYFGTAHARIYLAADLCHINCPTGMSALMRKNLLDEVGGFKAFGQYLAEDFFFAKSFTDRGWKLRISSQPAWQNSGICDLAHFQNRLTRWAKLRLAMVPQTTALEPFSECMLLGILAAWAGNFLFEWDGVVVCLVHILIWFFLDWILLSIIQNGSLSFSKTDFVIAWMFRECSAMYLFLKALWERDIRWRTGVYRLRWGGFVEEIKPKL